MLANRTYFHAGSQHSRLTALLIPELLHFKCRPNSGNSVQCAICIVQSAICIVQSCLYYIHNECGLEVLYTVPVYYLPFNTVPKSLPIEKHTLTILYSVTYNILYRPLYRLYWANLGLNRPLLAYIPRPIHIGMGYLALGLSMYVTLYRVQTLYSCTLICRQCLFNILYIVQCTCIRLV